MVEKQDIKYKLPSDAQINASSPGTLAIERFKLALALDNKKNEDLKDHLVEEDNDNFKE